MTDLDEIDRMLMRELSLDAAQTAGALGRRLGLSQPATWRRIRKLETSGILKGRRLKLNAEALGFGVTVFLGIKLATKGRVSLEDFERAVSAIQLGMSISAGQELMQRAITSSWQTPAGQCLSRMCASNSSRK